MQLAPLALAPESWFTESMLMRDYLPMYLQASPEIRGSQLCRLNAMQRESIGKCVAPPSAKQVIDYVKERRLTVAASTAAQDVIYLRGALEYAKYGLGIDGISAQAITEALPILRRQRLIGASQRRSQRPTEEQTRAILAHVGPGINADVIEFQDKSARRISETCRAMHGDLQGMTLLVRDMKHPTMKRGHNVRVAIPEEAYAIIQRQPRLTNDPQERIFKASAKTVQAAYHRACVRLGYSLHLHDHRGHCLTRLLESGRSIQHVLLVSGHTSPNMLLTKYNKLKAEDYHA